MRHKLLLSILLLAILPPAVFAQVGLRVVRGTVVSDTGAALPDAIIKTDTSGEYSPKEDGTFELRIPSNSSYLVVSAEKYRTKKVQIDGSYLYIRLEHDSFASSGGNSFRLEKEETNQSDYSARKTKSVFSINAGLGVSQNLNIILGGKIHLASLTDDKLEAVLGVDLMTNPQTVLLLIPARLKYSIGVGEVDSFAFAGPLLQVGGFSSVYFGGGVGLEYRKFYGFISGDFSFSKSGLIRFGIGYKF